MKYKSAWYARALAEIMVESKVGDKIIADRFLDLLQKNGDMKKAGEILALAERIALKKTGNKKIILETARPQNTSAIKKIIAIKGDVVEEKVNPALVAGITITVDNEKQIDFSLLGKLKNF